MKIAREKNKEILRAVEIKKIKVLDAVYTLLFKIQRKHLKGLELSNYMLSKNIEGKAK